MTTTALQMQTLARSYQEILHGVGGTPWVPLGNFMLDFFRNFPTDTQRAQLIADPIQLPSAENLNEDARKWAVFCAASAEHMARRYGLEIPAWSQDPAYATLPEAWYFSPMSYVKENIRQLEEQRTPPEFARRNIYCGEVYIDKYARAQELKARKAKVQEFQKTA